MTFNQWVGVAMLLAPFTVLAAYLGLDIWKPAILSLVIAAWFWFAVKLIIPE